MKDQPTINPAGQPFARPEPKLGPQQGNRAEGSIFQKETITIDKREWERVQKEREEYLDGWRRAKADYVNFKKDTEERRDEFIRFSTQSAIMAFLPLYDHLVRALTQLDESMRRHTWVEGIKKIVQQFEKTLSELGVKRIDAEGTIFDPHQHEAVGTESHAEQNDHTVLKVLQNGYSHHDKVIIPAKVIINTVSAQETPKVDSN